MLSLPYAHPTRSVVCFISIVVSVFKWSLGPFVCVDCHWASNMSGGIKLQYSFHV